ncbi:hypothetical protein DFQ26_000877, partial [Actinomortierella ambigua]
MSEPLPDQLAQQQHQASATLEAAQQVAVQSVTAHQQAASATIHAAQQVTEVARHQLARPSAAIKFPAPSAFDGKTDGFSALAFLSQLDRYFRGNSIGPDLQTLYATAFLTDSARIWFEGSGISDAADFVLFKDAFCQAFVSKEFDYQLRTKIAALRMSSSVATYVSEFRVLLSHLLSRASNDAS